jgi:hypothetical protein
MPDLWEEFLWDKLFDRGSLQGSGSGSSDTGNPNDIEDKLQNYRVKQQVSERSNVIFEDPKGTGKDGVKKYSLGTHRPDFVMYKDDKSGNSVNEVVAILDAKFWSEREENEYFDKKVVSDMKLFDANICGLIYPSSEAYSNSSNEKPDEPVTTRKFKLESEEPSKFKYTWINTKIIIPTHDGGNNYESWKNLFNDRVDVRKEWVSQQLHKLMLEYDSGSHAVSRNKAC